MGYDEFFTDGDKPYAENLNDGLLLMDAFDVTVPCKMPVMFSNGEFNSTTNVKRKAGIAIITLKSVDSGVTVGTTSISGTGDVVFRIYPNFNSFYKWYSIILEKTGSVNIAFKKTDGTSISASVGNDGVISEASALKELQEIDVVLTLSNATINSILVNFVNNQSSRVRTGALLEASQLTNVNGVVAENETKAVNGDTVYNAVNAVDEELEELSDTVSIMSNILEQLIESTFTPTTTIYTTNYVIADSKINVNLNGLTLAVQIGGRTPLTSTINAGEKKLNTIFDSHLLVSTSLTQNWNVKVISPISGNVLFNKTYDKNGDVVN